LTQFYRKCRSRVELLTSTRTDFLQLLEAGMNLAATSGAVRPFGLVRNEAKASHSIHSRRQGSVLAKPDSPGNFVFEPAFHLTD
jgi:hypothetical protein